MIIPINKNILIEPLKHDSFISSDKGTYEEVGIVVNPGEINLNIGDKVYFDAWLAGKFPKNDKEYFWLVNYEDIKAIEKNEQIPK